MFPKITAQLARGFLMGAADVVPGVSGGTIALVLGIYNKLIATVRSGARALGMLLKGDLKGFWKRFTSIDWLFLAPLIAGIGIAVVSLAPIIETQLHDNPEEMAGLFFGLVTGSVTVGLGLLTKRTNEHVVIMLVVGVAVFQLLGFQSGPVIDPSPLVFVGAGALAICAMILPGISGSFILLMMGMYAAVLGAVHDQAFTDIALVGIGAIIGLALFSSLLGWVLDRQFNRVMAALIGLMLGSLRVLWPWPNGVGVVAEDESEVIDGTGLEWPTNVDAFVGPAVLTVVGFSLVMVLTQVGRRYES
ncbi:MAG: DUF368 domain-containing protein [Acidimicrobiales bacterium]|nr:DUF368 domain-containing protein [Acidimicrobiales bacterium]MDG1877801.1 DUF368 domain-containing protein [Acidimicrobiales bacterium]